MIFQSSPQTPLNGSLGSEGPLLPSFNIYQMIKKNKMREQRLKRKKLPSKQSIPSAIFHFCAFIFLPQSSEVFGECVYFGQIL